jgi:hypothetical protein
MLVTVTLKNEFDLFSFRVGRLEAKNIRELNLKATLGKNWKCRLVISDEHQKLLGVPTKVLKTVFYDETSEHYVKMSEAIEVGIGNRRTTVCPFVMPNLNLPVIGSVLLEELNLKVDSDENLIFLERVLRI